MVTLAERAYVGRLVRRDVAETVLVDVVRMEHVRLWGRFLLGELAHTFADGRTLSVLGQAEPAGVEVSFPTLGVIGPRPWPGDLEALRAL